MKHKKWQQLLQVVFLMCGLYGSVALASTIVVQSGNVYTGIMGLTVDGVDYDATFHSGSYSSVYGLSSPTFMNNRAAAFDAVVSIQAAMNSMPYLGIGGYQYQISAYFVPYDHNLSNGYLANTFV